MDVRPFISYAREDRPAAMEIHAELVRLGATPWIDVVDLVGGQEWQTEISRALKTSSHFIALLSHHSVTKRGYVQKEVRQALDILDQFPPGKIYVVPVRLDATEPTHESLRKLHWIDVFHGYDDAIRQLARSLGLNPPAARQRHPLTPMLSDKAMLILSEAGKTATGLISRWMLDQALVVKVNNHSFTATLGDGRGRAELEDALRQLEDERLIGDCRPPKREMFQLTSNGFRLAQEQSPGSTAGVVEDYDDKLDTAEEITTDSKEGVMVGEVQTIVFSADQIYRPVLQPDEGIDGEIEFRNARRKASGLGYRVQLKSGDSHLRKLHNGTEKFSMKPHYEELWARKNTVPVLLITRSKDGRLRYMNATEAIRAEQMGNPGKPVKQIVFKGEDFTKEAVLRLRDERLKS